MEKDTTTIILDLRKSPAGALEYAIQLDCYYPVTIDEKRKGDLAERIVTIGRYKDLEAAKQVGREMWIEYSKDAMKELRILESMLPVFKHDNFKQFENDNAILHQPEPVRGEALAGPGRSKRSGKR